MPLVWRALGPSHVTLNQSEHASRSVLLSQMSEEYHNYFFDHRFLISAVPDSSVGIVAHGVCPFVHKLVRLGGLSPPLETAANDWTQATGSASRNALYEFSERKMKPARQRAARACGKEFNTR